jgi:hypothetical protein
MVDGHGAVGGSFWNLHPEETSGGEEFLLPDRGLISKRDVKMMKDFGEETTKWKKFVEVMVGDEGEDNGSIVDGEGRVYTIKKFGKIPREVVKGSKFREDVVSKDAGDEARNVMNLGLSPRKDGFCGDEDLGKNGFRIKR